MEEDAIPRIDLVPGKFIWSFTRLSALTNYLIKVLPTKSTETESTECFGKFGEVWSDELLQVLPFPTVFPRISAKRKLLR